MGHIVTVVEDASDDEINYAERHGWHAQLTTSDSR